MMQVCIYLYMFACSFGPTTYRKFQMSAFKYFMKIDNHEVCDDQLLPECQRQQSTTEVEAHMASCVCLNYRPLTGKLHSKLLTDDMHSD